MNKNIIMTSCGIINDDFKKKFYEIIDKNELNNKKMLYITTAADGDKGDKSLIDKEYKTILDLGVEESNITEYKIGTNEINLNNFDLIYMLGGNTIYLLDMIRKYKFDKKIIEAINKGIIYIGSSAGSEILGNSIETSIPFEDNNVNMVNFTGLKLVDGIIIPHSNRKKEFIDRVKQNTNENLYLLYDGGGVIL